MFRQYWFFPTLVVDWILCAIHPIRCAFKHLFEIFTEEDHYRKLTYHQSGEEPVLPKHPSNLVFTVIEKTFDFHNGIQNVIKPSFDFIVYKQAVFVANFAETPNLHHEGTFYPVSRNGYK